MLMVLRGNVFKGNISVLVPVFSTGCHTVVGLLLTVLFICTFCT